MTDRELLELAAKAAGYEYECTSHTGYPGDDQHQVRHEMGMLVDWNPLTDDGDALRLANSLFLSVIHASCMDDAPVVMVGDYMDHEKLEQHAAFPDENKEVRRAIVRAAAEIGKGMQ